MNYASGIGEAGMRVAEENHVFGVAEARRKRIDRLVRSAQELFCRTQLLGRLVPNLYQSLIFLIIVGGLAILYAAGTSRIPSLGSVVLLLVRAGTYGQQIQGAYQFVLQSLPFVGRLQEAERRYRKTRMSPARQCCLKCGHSHLRMSPMSIFQGGPCYRT